MQQGGSSPPHRAPRAATCPWISRPRQDSLRSLKDRLQAPTPPLSACDIASVPRTKAAGETHSPLPFISLSPAFQVHRKRVFKTSESGWHCGQYFQKKGNQKGSQNCRYSILRPCRVGRGHGAGKGVHACAGSPLLSQLSRAGEGEGAEREAAEGKESRAAPTAFYVEGAAHVARALASSCLHCDSP